MRWDDVEGVLVRQAGQDLAEGGDVDPCFVAFAGEQPLLMAFVRPFPKGEYHGPLTELLALAGGLAADRLALSVAGRVWSFDDPIPPVVPGVGDLRQRVLCVLTATPTGCEQAMHPFTPTSGGVTWEPPVRESSGTGWIAEAMRLAVARRADLRAGDGDVAAQAQRCRRLGHHLGLEPSLALRLGLVEASGQERDAGASNG